MPDDSRRTIYTMAHMETKVLDNGSAYALVKSQDSRNSIQFLTVFPNHERNRESLGSNDGENFKRGLSRRGSTVVRRPRRNPTRVP